MSGRNDQIFQQQKTLKATDLIYFIRPQDNLTYSIAYGDLLTVIKSASLLKQGLYGDATHTPQITVDSSGQITSITNVLIAVDASNVTNLTSTIQSTTGAMFLDSASIDFTYDSVAKTITGVVIPDTTVQRTRFDLNGTLIATRPEINFIAGSGVSFTLTDNAGSNRVDLTINATSSFTALKVDKNGALVSTRQEVNFIESPSVSITVADNIANSRADITPAVIPDSTVQRIRVDQDGTVKGARPELNFTSTNSASVSVTDDPANNRVNINYDSKLQTETVTVDVFDSSGNNNHGAFQGTPTLTYVSSPRGLGQALKLNGSNSAVVAFNNDIYPISLSKTIDFDFYLDDDTYQGWVLWKRCEFAPFTANGNSQYDIIYSGGYPSFLQVRLGRGVENVTLGFYRDNSGNPFLPGVNYRIRVVVDLANHKLGAYVGGIRTGLADFTGTTIGHVPGEFLIGSDRSNPSAKATLEEMKILDYAVFNPASVSSYTLNTGEFTTADSPSGLYHFNGPVSYSRVSGISLPTASTTQLGITKISYPALDLNNPIAVSTTDPILKIYPMIFGRR